MDHFIFSLEATVPIFLVIVLGYVLMQIGMFNKEFTAAADKYVFHVALPLALFEDIAATDIHEVFDLKFVIFCMVVTTVMFLGVWFFANLLIKDKSIVGAFTQGTCRGSAAVFGIAFVENIYGNSGMAPLMIVAAVPLYNIYSVIILTLHSKDREQGKGAIRTAFVNVAKNPIILGILAGLLVSLAGIRIPSIPAKAISRVAATATPIALLVVGAGFEGRKALAKLKPTITGTFIKLILLPAIFFPFAIRFGFRGSELVAILVMLGAPTTVSCYIMAKNMGNDEVLSSSMVVLATAASSVTLTMWIYFLKVLELI